MAISVGGLAPEKVEGTEALADKAGSEVQSGRADGTCCNKRRADRGRSRDGGVRSRELGQSRNDGGGVQGHCVYNLSLLNDVIEDV